MVRDQDQSIFHKHICHAFISITVVALAQAQHTRYRTVILVYYVMKLHAMTSTLLDILDHSYGLNLQIIKEISLVYLFS